MAWPTPTQRSYKVGGKKRGCRRGNSTLPSRGAAGRPQVSSDSRLTRDLAPCVAPPHARAAPLRRCPDAHSHRPRCFARTGHIMADAHVFWQLDGSIRVMVYTLVVAHVGALVCSPPPTHHHPLATPPHPAGRYSGACRPARGRRPIQRSRDDRRQSWWHCARERAPFGGRGLSHTVSRERCS